MTNIDQIKNSQFARQVLMLVTGAGLGQVISFAASLVTSRLFDPYEFGILAFFNSLIGIVGVFATGKYDLGIVVVKNEEDVDKLIRLCRRILFIFSFLLTVLGLVLWMYSEKFHLDKGYVEWLPFSGLAVFLSGYAHVLYMFYTRVKGFKVLTYARIIESVFLNGFTIIFWYTGAWALLIGLLMAQAAAIFYYSKKIREFERTKAGKIDFRSVAKEYSEFPKYNILLGFLDMYQSQSVVLLGSLWFQSTILGLYGFSLRLLQVPLWLVIRPVSHVFFSRASELSREGKPILPLVSKTILISFLLATPFFLILFFFGPVLFAFFFGEKWRAAGELSSLLSFWMILDLVRAPIAQIPVVIGKQQMLLYWTVAGSVISTLAVIYAGMFYFDNMKVAFAIITAAQSFYCLLVIFICFILAKKSDYDR